ncbi:hypothetical protein [Mesorhizobium sp.]|uniref:hypothetical protein n=1 Tax=Mesorhizobium sp. TaxID=1871066 RepID=UPI00257A0FCF|nr:hypothetical protein [Mesorhizobium sp.]
MTTTKEDTAGPETFRTEAQKGPVDPVNKPQEPVKADILAIGAAEPYPTGKPPVRTWAQINGFEAA